MRFSLETARNALSRGDYKTALMHYCGIMHWLIPSRRREYLSEYKEAIQGLVRDEHMADDEKLALLSISRELFGNEVTLLNLATQFYFSIGKHLEAFNVASEACEAAVSAGDGGAGAVERLHALVNRENSKSNIMDQWHMAMLNDSSRNEAYAKAIQMAIQQQQEAVAAAAHNVNARVLDIGGGTGFLSVIARRFTPNVYCCEMNETIVEFAKQVTEGSGITIIPKHSTEVTVEDLDNQKANVVITETMDCAVLGEGIIGSLLDAHRRLISPKSLIVPNRATVYACLVECQAISDEHVAVVRGNRFISPYILNGTGCNLVEGCEPYWCSYVNELKGGFKYLSGSAPMLEIDFNDPVQLEHIFNGIHREHTIEVHQSGRINAIMVWFRCTVYPGVAVLSTSPESSTATCWQQAVYPLAQPLSVENGDRCVMAVNACDDRLCCEIVRCIRAAASDINNANANAESDDDEWELLPEHCEALCSLNDASSSSSHDKALDNLQLESGMMSSNSGREQQAKGSGSGGNQLDRMDSMDGKVEVMIGGVEHMEHKATILYETDFLFLNDTSLVSFFAQSLRALVKSRRSATGAQQSDMRLVDISDVASISGSMASYNENYRCTCYYQNAEYCIVMNAFQIHQGICALRPFDDNSGFTCNGDVLLCWPITSSGMLCEHSLNKIVEWKMHNPNSIIIPGNVNLYAQMISCPRIAQRSRPIPSSHSGVNLSAMKRLNISYYYDIEPSTLPYEKLSEPFKLLSLRFDAELPSEPGVLPNFLQQINVQSEVLSDCDGLADGLLCWYELSYEKAAKYSTRSGDTNARCAMFVFDESVMVERDQRFALSTSLFHSNIIIEMMLNN